MWEGTLDYANIHKHTSAHTHTHTHTQKTNHKKDHDAGQLLVSCLKFPPVALIEGFLSHTFMHYYSANAPQ